MTVTIKARHGFTLANSRTLFEVKTERENTAALCALDELARVFDYSNDHASAVKVREYIAYLSDPSLVPPWADMERYNSAIRTCNE